LQEARQFGAANSRSRDRDESSIRLATIAAFKDRSIHKTSSDRYCRLRPYQTEVRFGATPAEQRASHHRQFSADFDRSPENQQPAGFEP
jgi:hypothetical protein